MSTTLRIQADERCEGTGDVFCGVPATCIVEVPDIYGSQVYAACTECACEGHDGEIIEIL